MKKFGADVNRTRTHWNRGKQFTYALLEERVPPVATPGREEALGELTRRYFSSRGPATVRDYVWWSGLTTREARAGIDMTRSTLAHEVVDGRTYWFVPSRAAARCASPSVHLLPNYDEFGIAYKDRDVASHVPRPRGLRAPEKFAHLLVIDGQIVGRWRRTLNTRTIAIELQPFRSLTTPERRALDVATTRYGTFMNRAVTISTS